MSTKILRPKSMHGPDGKLGVSKTVFWDDYVWREGGEEFIPGTQVRRLRLTKLSKRAVGAFEDEVDQLIEALRAERDAASVRRS